MAQNVVLDNKSLKEIDLSNINQELLDLNNIINNKDWLKIPCYRSTNIKNWIDSGNIQRNADNDVTFARFYAVSNEADYNRLYDLPCVDGYYMIFNIDNNIAWIKIICYDIRTNNVWMLSKRGDTWGNWERIYNSNPGGTNDIGTTLLLAGNTIKDTSLYKRAIYNYGVTVANTGKVNNTSFYFNGSAYLVVGETSLIDGLKNWTVDYWQNTSGYGSGAVVHQNCSGSSGYGPILCGYDYNTGPKYYAATANGNWSIASAKSMGSPIKNAWVHYAIVRNGNNFTTYQNGIAVSSWTTSDIIYRSSEYIKIGIYNYAGDSYITGYIDHLRISSYARWTSNFTPPQNEIDYQ